MTAHFRVHRITDRPIKILKISLTCSILIVKPSRTATASMFSHTRTIHRRSLFLKFQIDTQNLYRKKSERNSLVFQKHRNKRMVTNQTIFIIYPKNIEPLVKVKSMVEFRNQEQITEQQKNGRRSWLKKAEFSAATI